MRTEDSDERKKLCEARRKRRQGDQARMGVRLWWKPHAMIPQEYAECVTPINGSRKLWKRAINSLLRRSTSFNCEFSPKNLIDLS